MSSSEAKQTKTVIGGIKAIMHGWNNPDVDSAESSLESAVKQEQQAYEVYDQASEQVGNSETVLKTAKSNARKEVVSGVGEVAEGSLTAPLRLTRATLNKIIDHPALVGLPVALVTAFSVAQYNDINFPDMDLNMAGLSDVSVSTPSFYTSGTSSNCTNDNGGLRSQLGGFNSLSNAQRLVRESEKTAPTGTFKIVCGTQNQPDYLVRTNIHCHNAILMGVAEQGNKCTTLDRQQLAQN